MNNSPIMVVGLLLLVVCGVCIFVAIERYNANAQGVKAMNQMGFGNSSMHLRPATPAATKYAIAASVMTGIGGIICLMVDAQEKHRRANKAGVK